MKQAYPNVITLANPADRLTALEELCRAKVAEVLQAYLEAGADELIERRRYKRVENGVPIRYRNGHDPERLITTRRENPDSSSTHARNDVRIGGLAEICSPPSEFGSYVSQALARRAFATRF
ncbi:MAG: hypothetical protein M3R51_02330 [Candidatus Eremiobacteraeota bacterium]|nr:hypothetical protein [Candidatus Eremiobacteraeota bacterium]